MTNSSAWIGGMFCGALALLFCVKAMDVAGRLRLLDVPDKRKHHRAVTPLMGGICILFAILPSTLVSTFATPATDWHFHILVWGGCTAAMALLGMADDRHSLSARDRILVSLLVFGSAALLDPLFNVRFLSFRFTDFEFGFGGPLPSALFTMVCCVGLVNAVNMADGKNGLVIGLCCGWIGYLALSAPSEAILPFVMTGAGLLALLLFNLRGKLFLGDGGSYGFATGIGLLGIALFNSIGIDGERLVQADELVALFAIPVIDSFRLTFARMRRGQSPMAADRDHLHHHLQSALGWPGGLVVYLLMALAPAFILRWWPMSGAITLFLAIIGYVISLRFFSTTAAITDAK